jgi:antirestriction protein ArdC
MPNSPGFIQDSRACYWPSTDTVGMPARSAFNSAEEYYSTLFHELTSDSRLIVSAASQAQKAADYILARADQQAESEPDTKGGK